MPGCLAFPDELLLNIFEFLSGGDIARLRLSCKRFAQVGLDEIVWRDLCERVLASGPTPRQHPPTQPLKLATSQSSLLVRTPFGDATFPGESLTYYHLYTTFIHPFSRYLGWWFSQETTAELCTIYFSPPTLAFHCAPRTFAREPLEVNVEPQTPPHEDGTPQGPTRLDIENALGFKFDRFEWNGAGLTFTLTTPSGHAESSLSIDYAPSFRATFGRTSWSASTKTAERRRGPVMAQVTDRLREIVLDTQAVTNLPPLGPDSTIPLFYAPKDLENRLKVSPPPRSSLLGRIRRNPASPWSSQQAIRLLLDDRNKLHTNFASFHHMPLPLLGPVTKGWSPDSSPTRVRRVLTQDTRPTYGPPRSHKGKPFANVRFPLVSPPRKIDSPFPYGLDPMQAPLPEHDPASESFDWSLLEGLWVFTTIQNANHLVYIRTRLLTEADWTVEEKDTDMEPLTKVQYHKCINLSYDSVHAGVRVVEGIRVTGDWFTHSGHVFFRAFVVEAALHRTGWRPPITGARRFPPWPIREDGRPFESNLLPCRNDQHRQYSSPLCDTPELQAQMDAGRTPGLLLPAQVRGNPLNQREPAWMQAQFHITHLGELRMLWERTGRVSVGHRFVDEYDQ